MKVARIVVLALVLMMSGAAQARTIRQPVPTSIAFWDRNHGVAGTVVYGPTDRSEGYLSTTSDGGRTWTIRWRGSAVWQVGAIRGTREAWAMLQPGRVVLRSKDGGRTWRRAGTAPSDPSFPTPRVGFAMRSRDTNAGPLVKTTDGGRSWRRVGAPCRKGWGGFAWSAAISFVSPSRGWVICKGQPGAGSQSKALYLTRDGGKTWRRLLNAYFEPARIRLGGVQSSGYVQGMAFTPTGQGLLWSTRGDSLRTRDGGRHWYRIRATSGDSREGYSGWLVNERVGFLLLQNNGRERWELIRTLDGGRTWRLVRSWLRH